MSGDEHAKLANNLKASNISDHPPADLLYCCIPSSMVNTAPHFGHFTLASLAAYAPHPNENTAKTAKANTMLASFFTPLHLLSF